MYTYHVTSASAEQIRVTGLLCYDRLCEEGMQPTWKWDGDYIDTDVVCLFEKLSDAKTFAGLFGGQRIVVLGIPERADATANGLLYVTTDEGYLAVMSEIPAEYITEIIEFAR